MADSHAFRLDEICRILNSVTNKTLGEVDTNHVFNRAITNPKITGIAGDVIEQSVLGYPSDSDQRPDLEIDGVLFELKTTGIRENKKSHEIEAKEPASITAVSIDSIVSETFETSAFWHKSANMLFVFYHYDSQETVRAAKYADFFIRGFEFYSFDGEIRAVLESDWQRVHDFIQEIQENYSSEEAKQHYPELSSVINDYLVYLDTAPKYPNPPRFRFRRRFVTMLVQQKFGKRLEALPDFYHGYSEVYKKCHEITSMHKGKTLKELCDFYHIDIEGKTTVQIKSYAEKIVVKMFGGKSSKISNIELFANFGLIGKTIAITSSGGRTEDMKLTPVDFDEIENKAFFNASQENDDFDSESSFYSYLHDHKLLCIVFRENPHNSKELVDLRKNRFEGFKVLNLDAPSIIDSAERTWKHIQELLKTNSLQSNYVYTKDGKQRINPNGLPMEATNLPKSKDYLIFLRGTGGDSSDKTIIHGVKLYKHDFWIKGSYIVDQLKAIEYL